MGNLLQDVRFGVRTLLKRPGFALIVGLILALAIGANTIIFSFVNVLVLRPLPIRDEKRVAFIQGIHPQSEEERARISEPDYLDFRDRAASFQALAAYRPTTHTLTNLGDPQRIFAAKATASFFPLWGLETVHGRVFQAAEDVPGAAGVAVLSHGFWTRQFDADPSVIGRVITLDGRSFSVVGILTPAIEIGGLGQIEMWTPMATERLAADRNDRALRVTGRLAPGVTVEQASAEVAAIAKQLEREHPETNANWGAMALGARDSLVGSEAWLILSLLVVVVGGVLVVGCANVANLMLARATGRSRELAIRAALGASRLRMVRQLITEGALLAILGGAGGLGLAWAGMRVIRAVAFEPVFELIVLDPTVLLFGLGLALITPLIFSLIPALRASRTNLNDTLKETVGRASGGARGGRSRNLLVVSQLALSCALLIVAGLILRTIREITKIPWGFESAGVLTFTVDLPQAKYAGDQQVRAFYDQLLPRLRGLAGVRGAAVVSPLPLFARERTVQLAIDGHQAETPRDQPWAVVVQASEGYLDTLRLPLLRGRDISVQDGPETSQVALISRELARRYWPGADPIGKRLALQNRAGELTGAWLEVIGMTSDLRSPDLTDPPKPTVFLPLAQSPRRDASIVVKGLDDPTALVAGVRAEVRRIDPDLAIFEVKTLERYFDEDNNSSRILSGMFTGFAVIALLMAAAGLYAVISYSVSQRTQEIGIRMALGAGAAQIRTLIMGQGFKLIAVSIALGLLAGFALARLMTSLLYGIAPTDPTTYATVALILMTVALAGSYLPARRATRVDPVRTLRAE